MRRRREMKKGWGTFFFFSAGKEKELKVNSRGYGLMDIACSICVVSGVDFE
jgi:hypothetical protein